MSAAKLGGMGGLCASLCLCVGLAGCTVRYSQTVAGEIRRVGLGEIQTADTGMDSFGIAFSEPKSSHELLNIPCDAGLVAVDYRALSYGPFSVPEVQVISYCVP